MCIYLFELRFFIFRLTFLAISPKFSPSICLAGERFPVMLAIKTTYEYDALGNRLTDSRHPNPGQEASQKTEKYYVKP